MTTEIDTKGEKASPPSCLSFCKNEFVISSTDYRSYKDFPADVS